MVALATRRTGESCENETVDIKSDDCFRVVRLPTLEMLVINILIRLDMFPSKRHQTESPRSIHEAVHLSLLTREIQIDERSISSREQTKEMIYALKRTRDK